MTLPKAAKLKKHVIVVKRRNSDGQIAGDWITYHVYLVDATDPTDASDKFNQTDARCGDTIVHLSRVDHFNLEIDNGNWG